MTVVSVLANSAVEAVVEMEDEIKSDLALPRETDPNYHREDTIEDHRSPEDKAITQ